MGHGRGPRLALGLPGARGENRAAALTLTSELVNEYEYSVYTVLLRYGSTIFYLSTNAIMITRCTSTAVYLIPI